MKVLRPNICWDLQYALLGIGRRKRSARLWLMVPRRATGMTTSTSHHHFRRGPSVRSYLPPFKRHHHTLDSYSRRSRCRREPIACIKTRMVLFVTACTCTAPGRKCLVRRSIASTIELHVEPRIINAIYRGPLIINLSFSIATPSHLSSEYLKVCGAGGGISFGRIPTSYCNHDKSFQRTTQRQRHIYGMGIRIQGGPSPSQHLIWNLEIHRYQSVDQSVDKLWCCVV